MRRIIIMLMVVMAFTLLGCQRGPAVHTAAGSRLSLSSLQGKWVLLVYWGSWCEACRDNMPQLNAFYQSSDEKTTVLGFNNMLLPGETLKQAMTKVKIDFPVIEESLSAYYHLPRIDVEPTAFVINPRGKLVKVVQGMTTVAKLEVIMKNLKHAFQLPQKQIMPTQSPLEETAHFKQDTLKKQPKLFLSQRV